MTSKSFVIRKNISKTTEHLIHDNGGRPFKVIVNHFKITIYRFPQKSQPDYSPVRYTEFVEKYTKFIGYWIGVDPSNSKFNGNSILIQITKKDYVYVGTRIYSFTTIDEILDYVSFVGNSDVPCPLAYGNTYLYFMTDQKYVDRKKFKTVKINPMACSPLYEAYYRSPESELPKSGFLNVKLIAKRRAGIGNFDDRLAKGTHKIVQGQLIKCKN